MKFHCVPTLIFVFSETNEMSEPVNAVVRENWLLFGSTITLSIHSWNEKFECGTDDMGIVISSLYFRWRSITRDIMNTNRVRTHKYTHTQSERLQQKPASVRQFRQLYEHTCTVLWIRLYIDDYVVSEVQVAFIRHDSYLGANVLLAKCRALPSDLQCSNDCRVWENVIT